MAVVPITEGNRVRQAPAPSEKLAATDQTALGRAAGEGLQRAGAAGADFAQFEADLEIKRAENKARDADIAAAPELSEIEARFRALRGVNATPESVREAEAEFGKIRDKHSQGLDPLAQRMFGQVAQRRVADSLVRLRSHTIEQVRVGQIETAEARITTAGQLAVDQRDDPEAFSRNLETIDSESRTLAQAQGWGEERRTAYRNAQISNIHRRVIETLRVQGDNGPRAAEAWLNSYSPEVNDEDERILRDGLKAPLEELQSVDDYLGVRAEASGVSAARAAEAEANPVEIEAPTAPTEAFTFKPTMLSPRAQQGRGSQQHGYKAVDIKAPMGDPIYAPAEAEVISVDPNPAGNEGMSVRVRLLDGTNRQASFAHMSRITVKKGDKVGPNRSVGAVGSTGRSTGPHIHFSVFDAGGQRLEPMAQKYGGSDGKGGKFVRSEPSIGGTETLYQAAYAKAEREGWSQPRLDRVLRRVDSDAARNEALLREQETVASRQAAAVVGELGPGGLTSTKQLGDAYFRMSPQDRLQYDSLIQKNLEPAPAPDNWALLEQIQVQRMSDPEGFLQRNVAQDLAGLSKSQQSTYNSWRLEVLGRVAKPEEQKRPDQIAHSTILNVARPFLDAALGERPKKGDKLEAYNRREVEFREDMSLMIRQWQTNNPGRQIGQDDIYEIARRATTSVVLSDGTQVPAFERNGRPVKGALIPVDARNAIIGEFRRRYGRDPAQTEISAIYFEGVRR